MIESDPSRSAPILKFDAHWAAHCATRANPLTIAVADSTNAVATFEELHGRLASNDSGLIGHIMGVVTQ